MSERVVLYRVKRPDGTVIEVEPSTGKGEAIYWAAMAVRELAALVGLDPKMQGHYWRKAEAAGYTIEPVEFAPLPSEETRATVELALRWQRDQLAGGHPNIADIDAALSELSGAWK